MAQQSLGISVEQLVREKVEEELVNLSAEGRDLIKESKTAKDVAAAIMPGIASIISVAVTTAVSTVVKDVTDKLLLNSANTKNQP